MLKAIDADTASRDETDRTWQRLVRLACHRLISNKQLAREFENAVGKVTNRARRPVAATRRV
jgi:hypothetical protein